MSWLLIALGSALGGVARYWCGTAIAARAGVGFPWGTLFINVLGSFLIGIVAALTEPGFRAGNDAAATAARDFLMVGVLGGYTTFSAFSLQTLALLREGRWAWAGGNVLLSVVLCLLAVWVGYALATALTSSARA